MPSALVAVSGVVYIMCGKQTQMILRYELCVVMLLTSCAGDTDMG